MGEQKFEFFQMTKNTVIKPFSCTDKDLTEFLLEEAHNYLNDLMAVTYIAESADKQNTLAYFSLLNDKLSYNPDEIILWNRINRLISNKKRRKSYPAVKIGRLAVNERYSGNHIGKALINNIVLMFILENKTGCRFITVDAYANATGFYQKCGFKFFSDKDSGDSTRLMFMDLKPIKERLEVTLSQN